MPPKKDREWFRNYAVFYKDSPTRIEAIEQLIVTIQNELNLSRSEALRAIFDAGVEIKAEDPQYGTVALKQAIAEARLFHALALEVERQKERAAAYKVLGPLGILEVAEQLGIQADDASAVIEACKKAVGLQRDLPPSHAFKVWISYHLQDGEEQRYEEIVAAAVEDEVLPPPDQVEEHKRALGLFKQVASSMGASGGRRGWWKMPTEVPVTEDKEDPF